MVVVGLGSNVGDREAYLRRAVQLLATSLTHMACSPIYESKALLPKGAPVTWDKPFYNMVVKGNTSLKPSELLETLKKMEMILGRSPSTAVWGPREIDMDIILYDHLVMEEPGLKIPHPAMYERDFVLLPLRDVLPDWSFRGQTIAEAVKSRGYKTGDHLKNTGIVIA